MTTNMRLPAREEADPQNRAKGVAGAMREPRPSVANRSMFGVRIVGCPTFSIDSGTEYRATTALIPKSDRLLGGAEANAPAIDFTL